MSVTAGLTRHARLLLFLLLLAVWPGRHSSYATCIPLFDLFGLLFDSTSQWLAETRQEHHVGEDEEGEDSPGLGIVEVGVEDGEEAEEELRMIPRFSPSGKMTVPRWLSDSNKYGFKTRWTRSLGLPDYKRELRRRDG